ERPCYVVRCSSLVPGQGNVVGHHIHSSLELLLPVRDALHRLHAFGRCGEVGGQCAYHEHENGAGDQELEDGEASCLAPESSGLTHTSCTSLAGCSGYRVWGRGPRRLGR